LSQMSSSQAPGDTSVKRISSRLAMGTFRSLWIQRPCEQCSTPTVFDLQFKTGRDRLEEYHVGQAATDLAPGGRYEGISGRYCNRCHLIYAKKRCQLTYEVVGELLNLNVLNAVATNGSPITTETACATGLLEAADFRDPWNDHPRAIEGGGLAAMRCSAALRSMPCASPPPPPL